jgi:c(7)-type cytochrome triheme protein
VRSIGIVTFGVAVALLGGQVLAAGTGGEAVYDLSCAPCHKGGLLGAPKTGDRKAWAPRVRKGTATLLDHSLNGFGDLMQPRGGNTTLSDDDVRAALAHMLASVGVSLDDPALAGSQGGVSPEPAPVARAATAGASTGSVSTPPAKVASAPTVPAAKPTAAAPARPAGVNSFNRLMKPPSERNPPPTQDGIHDPTSQGTQILQPPRESFGSLPKSKSGNRVDWVKALEKGMIAPRFDLVDADKQPVVMDLNIVREVKGSMPDVVYPHKQHTEWLDCSNCHPAIFKPQKGANPMSMANILLGKQCGVCHGKVAFPVGECRKCHSRKKPKSVAGQ